MLHVCLKMMDVVFALHWQCYMILRMDQNFKGCPVKPKLIDVDPSSNLYIFISGATKNDYSDSHFCFDSQFL
jgi:hypothetical protein